MKSLRRSDEEREKEEESLEKKGGGGKVEKGTKSNLHRPSHRWNLYARQRPVSPPSFLSHLNIFINILPATITRRTTRETACITRLLATI